MGIWLIRIGITAGPETTQASVQIPAPVFLWLILLGAGGGLLSRWLIDPFIERQSVQSPRGTVAEPPRLLVIVALVLTTFGNTLLPLGWFAPPGSNSFGVTLPPWAYAAIGAVVAVLSIVWDIRSGRGHDSDVSSHGT